MAFYQKKSTQKVNATMEEIWDFISSPKNLKEITPPYMGFDYSSDGLPDKMYQGMIISYKVSPVAGIKTDWVTEITHVDNMRYFVDEQRIGPYSMWHHQHWIEPLSTGGVLMSDIVTYQPPFGFLGAIANKIMIRKKLDEIFAYRTKAIEKKYGVYEERQRV